MPILEIPDYLAREALFYAPQRQLEEAVTHILEDYPRLVAEVRKLRSRVADLDAEIVEVDARVEALQSACRAIMEI
jgi:hypothetical protein